jgi:hypothetical protein
MIRYCIAALAAATLMFAACGGGGDDAKPTASAAADASPTVSNGLQQPIGEDKVLPTPTPAAADAVALTVVAGPKTFNPLVSEFRELPATDVKVGDKTYTGVSVAALGDKVSAGEGTQVTVQGIRADGKRESVLRYPLSEVGTNSVLVIDDSGHVSFVSSDEEITNDLWLTNVTAVAFQ